MKFRVKDYCRIILYLPPEDKLKLPMRKPKPKRIEDDVDVRLSEDDAPIKAEDATHPSPNHRPPSYNPEDYAHAIAKYARSSNIYAQDQREKKSRSKDKDKSHSKDVQQEMSLKQFASLPELLRRLREDLKTAYISFVKELVRDPHDGVTLLLDLLKMIQLAQSNLSGNPPSREQQIALRRALIDEFECLSCLRCCLRCSDSQAKLANYRNGLFCLAAATMSSLTRSRTIALQLLTKSCDGCVIGHRQVLEAFSTLRLRFSEPVRYKFLVSMMLSHPHPRQEFVPCNLKESLNNCIFQIWCLRFINALVGSSTSLRERVYLQEELGEAGFDCGGIRKALDHRGAATQQQQDAVIMELNKWNDNYIDISTLEEQLRAIQSSNKTLHQELQNIRHSNMKLLEENVLLRTVGGEVEFRCTALKRRLENHGIPSSPSPAPSMTDSEISSWATTGQNTIKRGEAHTSDRTDHRSISPTQTEGTMSTIDGEITTSPDWTMIRQPPRHSSKEQSFLKDNGIIPVPMKRQTLKSHNTYSSEKHDHFARGRHVIPINNEKAKRTPEEAARILQETQGNINNLNNMLLKEANCVESKERKPASESKGMSSETKINTSSKENEKTPASTSPSQSIVSVTSSTSSMSSSISLDGEMRKDPEYENLPKNETGRSRSRGSSEGEMEYERDVIVYEAITLGNDTIVLDKNNTHGSQGSNKSGKSHSSGSSGNFSDIPSVRQSVRHYENMANEKTKIQISEAHAEETILRRLRRKKKSAKPSSQSEHSKERSSMSSEVSEIEVEEVMNGLESILRSAESSISLNSMGTVKENPLCCNMSEESDSYSIPPPIPPRSSSGVSSSSPDSRDGTPEKPIYPSSTEASTDLDSLRKMKPSLTNPHQIDSDSSHSVNRFAKKSKSQNKSKLESNEKILQEDLTHNQPVKRSESLHTNASGYNSHKSYSPTRKPNSKIKIPLEESEVSINGRTYTRYTASDVEQNNRINEYMSAELKRRRNRSIDDQLDHWNSRETRRDSKEDIHGRSMKKNGHEFKRSSRMSSSDNRKHPSSKSRKSSKSAISHKELNPFNGFRNPTTTYRESDFGSNFVLSHPSQDRMSDSIDLTHFENPPKSKSTIDIRRKVVEDPAIPTPDYSATPAGTLTHPISGRHILDMPSGLY